MKQSAKLIVVEVHRLLDFRFQKQKIYLVLSIAFLFWLVLSGVRGSLYRALGLMVAASPCALAVAPLSYATAISSCARKVST